ncbi:MAG TPA: heme-binding protein [Candidatus Limnocylindrales bacterium]|nr:heme-binding protein [Candidatus Limnocylindrales bacterium]
MIAKLFIFNFVFFLFVFFLINFITPAGIPDAFAAPHVELTKADCDLIIAAAEAQANVEASALRVPSGTTTKMHIACVDRDGKIIEFRSMPDAWAGSIDIARAKANTARAFSSNENALSSRSIGCLSQAVTATNHPGATPALGVLWMIGNSNLAPAVKGNAKTEGFVGGIIQFPGGLPLYKDSNGDGINDTLVGAIGVSGDGVEEDEDVAEAGTKADQPGAASDYQAPSALQTAAPFFIDPAPATTSTDGDPCTLGK